MLEIINAHNISTVLLQISTAWFHEVFYTSVEFLKGVFEKIVFLFLFKVCF